MVEYTLSLIGRRYREDIEEMNTRQQDPKRGDNALIENRATCVYPSFYNEGLVV